MATEYKLFFKENDSENTEEPFGHGTMASLAEAERELAYRECMLKYDGVKGLLTIRSREVGDWS